MATSVCRLKSSYPSLSNSSTYQKKTHSSRYSRDILSRPLCASPTVEGNKRKSAGHTKAFLSKLKQIPSFHLVNELQCTIATAILLNNLVHGSGFAYAAVLLPQLRTSSIRLSSEDESWIASMAAVAMFVGNFLTVPAMRRGRKFTHYLVSLLNIAGWLIITLAHNFLVLMIGRFVQGLSIGLFIPVISVILGEYTSPSHRGTFLATVSLGQAIGVLFTHLVGSCLAWQDTALLLSCFSVVSFAIIVFTPESPSWLAVEGRYNECRKAFRWLRGSDEEEELNRMIQARQYFDSSPKPNSAFFEALRLLRRKELYIPLAIGAAMYVIMVHCGAIVLANYLNEIVEELLGPGCNVVAWMGILDGVRLASNCTAMYVVGRFPRRTLLFSTGAVCVFSHLVLSAYIHAKTAGLINHTWLAALFFICQIVTIGLGMMTLPFVILGEIFPLQYRGLCSFLCNITMGVMMFVAVKTFPSLRARAGLDGAWLVYGGAVALGLVVTWRLLPETRGRTLQEIEEHFRGRPMVPEDAEAMYLKGTKEENNKLAT